MRRALIPCMVALLYGCSVPMIKPDTSVQQRISGEMSVAAQAKPRGAASAPSGVSSSLLPPLRSAPVAQGSRQLEPRFNLKVNEAPVGQVLLAVVQDTPYSILLSPRSVAPVLGTTVAAGPINETLTVNLKDVTVFEALDAIRETYGYDYTVDGNRIYVYPPEMRTKLYQVNYVQGMRRGVSDVQVIGGASASSSNSGTGGTGGGTTGSSATSSYASIQASALSSIQKADLWGDTEEGLRTLLGCQIARFAAVPQGTGGGGGGGGGTGASSSSTNGSRADTSFNGEARAGERLRGAEGCPGGRAVAVNAMSGTIVVRGLPVELRQIEAMLRSLQLSIERQVIIEAKVVDVELNAGSQQGINWSGLHNGVFRGGVGVNPSLIDASNTANGATRGNISAGTTIGDLVGTSLLGVANANAFSAGLGIAVQATNFSALLNFLQTQGSVQVLSSPRISTLNNQKAVIKVGAEESFVTNISGGSSTVTNGIAQTTPPTLTYQPFFSGISLDVTPQIDENDNITLHVRTMVNTISEKEKIATPSGTSSRVPFAVNTISETDSVVKTRDGQVIVIGGLMSENSSDNRARVPGAGDVPLVGALFGKSDRSSQKRELVILLKPTVVKGDESWAGEIGTVQGRIERMNANPPRLSTFAQ